jgi:hypothetical protein
MFFIYTGGIGNTLSHYLRRRYYVEVLYYYFSLHANPLAQSLGEVKLDSDK